MGHVYVIALDLTNEIVYKVICNFHMPLFMFLTGLVASSGITAPLLGLEEDGEEGVGTAVASLCL